MASSSAALHAAARPLIATTESPACCRHTSVFGELERLSSGSVGRQSALCLKRTSSMPGTSLGFARFLLVPLLLAALLLCGQSDSTRHHFSFRVRFGSLLCYINGLQQRRSKAAVYVQLCCSTQHLCSSAAVQPSLRAVDATPPFIVCTVARRGSRP